MCGWRNHQIQAKKRVDQWWLDVKNPQTAKWISREDPRAEGLPEQVDIRLRIASEVNAA